MRIKLNRAATNLAVPKKMTLRDINHLRDMNHLEAFSLYKDVEAKNPKVFLKMSDYSWITAEIFEIAPNGTMVLTTMLNDTEVFKIPLRSIEFLQENETSTLT